MDAHGTATMSRNSLIRGQHLGGLDGLRGVAVACVVLHHLSHRLFQGGYVGVDLFFVLSGFLITSLLVEERAAQGSVDLMAFYARRAKRLFPALVASIALTALFIVVMGHWRPNAHSSLDLSFVRRSLFAAIFYVENFAHPSLQNPVTHMWSLAVEEQFYIVWPALFLLILRYVRRGRAIVVGGLSLIGLGLFAAVDPLSEASKHAMYTSSFARAGQLLAGATLALLLQSEKAREMCRRSVRYLAPVALVGFAVITQTPQEGGLVKYPPLWMFRGGYLATTVAGAVLIATVVLAPTHVVSRLLNWSVLRRLGLISYGLYVYHWIFVFYITTESTGLPWLVVDAIRVSSGLAIASVSYRYLEMPLRRLRYVGWKKALAPAGLAVAIGASLLATIPALGAPYGGPTPTTPVATQVVAAPLDTTGTLQPPVRPIRHVMILGDVAMRRISLPLVRALSGHPHVSVQNATLSPWGLTAASGEMLTPAAQRTNVNLTALGVRLAHADLVIMSSTIGDFVTARHAPQRYNAALDRLVRLVATSPESPRIVLVLGPAITLDGLARDAVATSRLNRAMLDVAAKWPGQVVVVGPRAITRRASVAPVFGPPTNRPYAPTSQWVRWRAPDGVGLCQPAAVMQAAIIAEVVEPILGPVIRDDYWRGAWTRSSLFLGPSRCIADHP